MAEALPSYRLHQPVHYTEGGALVNMAGVETVYEK